MDIRDVLSSLGMSDGEAKAYLALLELGTAPLSAVSRRAGLRKPAATAAMKELRRRGLIDGFPHKGGHVYSAVSPRVLFTHYAERFQAFERVLPELIARHDRIARRPRAGFDEGKAAMEKRYAEAWETEGELCAFLLPADSAAFFGKPALRKLYAPRSGADVKRSRFLCSGAPAHRLHAAALPSGARLRFLNPSFPLSTELFVCGDSVRTFSFTEGYAQHLESADAARTQKALFEAAWNAAK